MSGAMFKAVVWKELRENLKWAVVVLLGMAAVLAVAIPSADRMLRGPGVYLNQIFGPLEPIVMIGGVLAGLLLGSAQTLFENRDDKWGFLTHRPISRTGLFWGKAAAGVLIYTVSMGVPLTGALFWIFSPGHLPIPFDWRVALPVVANLLCGLVFYFAGLLTGMRDARWYASRALGIGAAVWCLGVQEAVATEFWQAVAASAAGLIVVGTAAWSTFVAGGQYGVQPRIGRIATGVSVGLGMTLVGWLLLVVCLNWLPEYEARPDFRNISYTLTSDGVVARVTFDGRRMDGRRMEVSDLAGRPLERYRNTTPGQPLSAGVVSVSLQPKPWAPRSFRSTNRLFSQLQGAYTVNPVGWYYVHRLGLIAAYDGESRRQIGWMGPDGFSPENVKPRPFAGRLIRASQTQLVFEDAVYRLDLENQSIEKIFQAEPAETILDAGMPQYNASTLNTFGEMAQFEVISTTRRVIVQRSDGTGLLAVPQDAKALRYPDLEVSRALQAPGVPTFLRYQNNLGEEGGRISEFDNAGVVVNTWTLPATDLVLKESLPRIALTAAIFPLTGQPSFNIGDWLQRSESGSRPRRPIPWPVAILSALLSAAAVFLRGRRYAFTPGRLGTWTGIALLLGPLGYLLMLALIEWPARESCPACSRKRIATRERCEHCGAPFAAPAMDGTEIFAPTLEPHT